MGKIMTWRKILMSILVLAVVLIIYLLFWPVSIDPATWTPPKAPALTGVYELNTSLALVERLGVGAGIGPEDVAVDGFGRIYGGMKDGRILRFRSDGTHPEVFVNTHGRPLGLHFDTEGNLVVADAYKGLLLITPDGSITVLAIEQGGIPFQLTNDVDIATNGTIYFSDASFKFPVDQYMFDLLEHQPNGRLLSYDMGTKTTHLVLDKLYFANGVAISPDQSFVLVAETGKYQVQRHWLTGPRKGESDIFIDNLPGFPDGISCNGQDTFWLVLFSPRVAYMDAILPHTFLRKVIVRLPQALITPPKKYGFVLGLNMDGHVVHNLQDPSGKYAPITSVQEYKGMLYLGSLTEDAIGRIPAPSISLG